MPPPDVISRYFPFRAIGYACNPFRALSVDEEGALTVLAPAVLAAFEGGAAHIQILGQKGRGKSATLHGLIGRAESNDLRIAYEYLPDGQDAFHTDLAELDLFVLDEAQRLSRHERHRLLTSPPRLIISSHTDLTPDFERHGLPLRAVSLARLGLEHVRAVLERRLEHFALESRPRAALTDDAYAWLTATFGDDLRAMIALLYEAFQDLREPAPVTAELLRTSAPLSRVRDRGRG